MVAESVEHRPHVWEIGSSIPSPVEPIAYQIDTCRFLAWCSALIGQGMDWLAQGQDNVTEWDIGSCCLQPHFPVGQYYKVTMSAQSQVTNDI